MRKSILTSLTTLLLLTLLVCPHIYADEEPTQTESTSEQTITEQVTNTNDTTAVVDHSIDANTGSNTSDQIVAQKSTQETGDINITDSITTSANTNVVGTDTTAQTIDVTTPDQSVDLSSPTPRPCFKPGTSLQDFLESENLTFDQFLTIMNTNDATILNTIAIKANTGDNSLSGVADEMTIKTGDIDATVNISTQANMNIVGDCDYFVIINIYADSNGDIILPYEFSALEDADSNSASTTSLTNTNTADTTDMITVTATTGSNSAKTIDTGNIDVTVQNTTTANTNLVGDNWVKLSINTFGSWSGLLLDWFTGAGEVHASELSTTTNTLDVTNNNTAHVTNTIDVKANTGGNTIDNENVIGKSEITTGSINVNVNTFNFLNNTIVGNNWWYAIINIFGNYSGNISIARPDLYLIGSSTKNLLNSGDEATFTASFRNKGRVFATGNWMTTTLPDYLELIDYSPGGVVSGNSLRWNMDDCAIQTECGSVWVRARLKYGDLITDGTRSLPFTIHTNMRETALSDNTFGVPFFAYIWTLDENADTNTRYSVTPNLPTIPNMQVALPNLPKTTKSHGTLLPALFTNHPNRIARMPNVLGVTKSSPIIPVKTHVSQLWLLGVLMGLLLSRRLLLGVL